VSTTTNFFDAIQRIKLLLDGVLPEQAEEHIQQSKPSAPAPRRPRRRAGSSSAADGRERERGRER